MTGNADSAQCAFTISCRECRSPRFPRSTMQNLWRVSCQAVVNVRLNKTLRCDIRAFSSVFAPESGPIRHSQCGNDGFVRTICEFDESVCFRHTQDKQRYI